jgi:hypothetical protein
MKGCFCKEFAIGFVTFAKLSMRRVDKVFKIVKDKSEKPNLDLENVFNFCT